LVIGKDLDGNDSVETGIAGAVGLAHPASANTREDFVTPSRFTLGPSQPGGTSAIGRVRPPTIPIRHRNSESHNLAFSSILNMSLMIRPATSNSVDCGQWREETDEIGDRGQGIGCRKDDHSLPLPVAERHKTTVVGG
jgi:hypothetical protein